MADQREDWLNRMTATLSLEPEDLIEVAAMFFEDIDDRLGIIAEAGHTGDLETLTLKVHGLKGDAANIGFMDISQVARDLEHQCRARAVVGFDEQLEALRAAVLATRESLEF
jgi:HPt (histidine-containing phosphotransfer) domain-containing protein